MKEWIYWENRNLFTDIDKAARAPPHMWRATTVVQLIKSNMSRCISWNAAGMKSNRPLSELVETHWELKRWTQTWRKCPLVTHSLNQPNKEGIMCMLIVECFFICPLLCGLFLSAKPLGWEWAINKGCISFIFSARQALTLFIQHETEDYYLLKGSTWLHVWDSCPEDQNLFKREPSLFDPRQKNTAIHILQQFNVSDPWQPLAPGGSTVKRARYKFTMWQSLRGQILWE